MIKLKDLLENGWERDMGGDPEAEHPRKSKKVSEGGKGSGRKRGPKAGLYTSRSKPRPKPGSKPQKAPKLKQFGEGKLDPRKGQTMTPQEKKRTISKLHRFDRPQLVNMLRSAADAANRGNARADDLAHIYRDELNNRDNIGEGNKVNEADHRKEAWDTLAQVKKDLRESYSTVTHIRQQFPLKGSQVQLTNSATSAIGTAERWVNKLMKDIARG